MVSLHHDPGGMPQSSPAKCIKTSDLDLLLLIVVPDMVVTDMICSLLP